MAEKNYITPDGYKRLVDELTELAVVERPRVVREVADAAAEGDRSENAAYIYGKRRLREIDRRLGFLKRRLEFVQVVEADQSRKDRVFFGAWVEVEDDEGEGHVYQIVGVDEVEAEHGRISWKSPIGHALIGKQLDESFVVKWHAGQRELTIVDIRYQRAKRGEADETRPIDLSVKPTATAISRGDDADEDDDEPFESDEDADRYAQARLKALPPRKVAKAAPKAKVTAKPKMPVPTTKALKTTKAETSRTTQIKAAATVKGKKKP
ncbi:MAG TPA: transcription elongation factor GreB [Polyangia bacterium]|jgi:transcription elongation factor GreB|nr:transcription elongation factor GreB [Polyangia bacterium]